MEKWPSGFKASVSKTDLLFNKGSNPFFSIGASFNGKTKDF